MSSSQQPENAAPLLIRCRTKDEVQQTFQDNQKLNSSLTVAIATNPRPLADHPVALPEELADSDDDEEDDEEEDTGAGRSSETDALPITKAAHQHTRFTDTKWGPNTFKDKPNARRPTMKEITQAEKEWQCPYPSCRKMNEYYEGFHFDDLLECEYCEGQVQRVPEKKREKEYLEEFGERNKAGEGIANVQDEGEGSSSTLQGSLADGREERGGSLGL
ncbi:hypothetical protein FB567DRAFT_628726 [Paraphoma chrysanthemicola]|uniref:Uncharacterized protein n=1 Tax=Paraphoma chrysanthemicola TaxID=798071 RepID=A0A8K0R7I5_9PLEO|nr:hypothetical protein FB567DRAFT_628726 [Paraphoma chrysanthemicola]